MGKPFAAKLFKLYKHSIYPQVKDKRGATRLYNFLEQRAMSSFRGFEGTPTSIFERGEWKNLVILDACRHDIYSEMYGDSGKRVSLGTCTAEYIENTFSDGDYSDTVYISANPHFYSALFEEKTGRKPSGVFHEVFHTYDTDWDEELCHVLPAAVARDAVAAAKLFPDKRKIIHFHQPHAPYVGVDIEHGRIKVTERGERIPVNDAKSIGKKVETGELSIETLRSSYRKNIKIAREEVDEMLEKLEGRTVLTSDHGEILGENGLMGHPDGGYDAKILREVPWHVLKG